MSFIDSIRRQLQAMNAMERQQAISSLRDLIYEDAYTHTTRPTVNDEAVCPRCGSLVFCFNVCSTGSAVFFRSVG